MKKLLLLIMFVTSCEAGVLTSMQSFFNQFGAVGNTTEGSAFQDQSAGYMTGGSLFIRNPVRTQRLGAMTAPGYRMGCGGIDLWAGGLSYINKDQLKQMMQSIISNMSSYAFMLAVETYAPQIHTIMHQLNKLAADFNRLNINSCETASALVGSAWPKSDLGSQSVCRMISAHQGMTTDWASARHECGVNRETHLKGPHQQDMLVGDFNLAWKVMEKMNLTFEAEESSLNPFPEEGTTPSETQTLKEILMTLSGTLIHRTNGSHGEDHMTLRAKGDDEGFLTALMQGGRIRYYKCDTRDKCLNPTETELVLEKDQSLQAKIQAILLDLVAKIQQDDGTQEATPAQKALVNISTLPIYKMINVTTAFQKGRAPMGIHEYGDLIAFDILYRYIQEVLTAFQEGAGHLREIQFNDDYIKEFVDGLRETRQRLSGFRQSIFSKMDLMLGFMEKIQLLEKQIHHMAGTLSHVNGS
jgi:conjugative transfer pilus assembly protein TraH